VGAVIMSQTINSQSPAASVSDISPRHILLIDDDRDMSEMLAEYLGPEGYAVHLAHTAQAGLQHANQPDLILIILDVMLPDQDGFSVLREVRQKSRIPIIMLTTRAALADKVNGLEAGADDYIPKPFTPIELLARIRCVLRRGQPSLSPNAFLIVDDLTLDAGSRAVRCHGQSIDCTTAEFDVLYTLTSCAGGAVTREHLTTVALGRSMYAGDRGVDNLISSLRKKLGPSANGQDRFRSVRNTGYIYVRATSALSIREP
jgi:two-component system, OmpR family, response regulator CpxR